MTKNSVRCAPYLRNHISYDCYLWYTCVKCVQNPHQILNSQAQKLENKDEILKDNARYTEEEEIEQKIDKKFQEIVAEGKADRGE